jgi:hypothetical protein
MAFLKNKKINEIKKNINLILIESGIDKYITNEENMKYDSIE